MLARDVPGLEPAEIDSINAHYDHYRALPADENAAHREIDPLHDGRSRGPLDEPGGVIFTMGCHSALPVSDFVVSAARCSPTGRRRTRRRSDRATWATPATASATPRPSLYSEKLNVLFAERLDGSMTVGQALVFAKQEYAATPDAERLPPEGDRRGQRCMGCRCTGSGPAPRPRRPSGRDDDGLGHRPADRARSTSRRASPGSTPPSAATTSSDDAFAENRRPIEPTTKLDVTEPGLVAHGALITALDLEDEANFDAAFSRVVDDSLGVHAGARR